VPPLELDLDSELADIIGQYEQAAQSAMDILRIRLAEVIASKK
jgi:hypothetical protein